MAASYIGVPLASSAAQTLDEAIVEVSEASYPIIRALDAKTLVPFTEKIGGLLLSLPSAKLDASIDAAIDVFDSVSPDKLKALNGAVGDAFGGLNVDSCTLVPLPSKAVAEKVQVVAADVTAPVPALTSATFPAAQSAQAFAIAEDGLAAYAAPSESGSGAHA